MEDTGLHIRDIRLLQLSRNAPSLLPTPENMLRSSQMEPEKPVCFSMFDYFDWLVVRKGRALDHVSCLGLDARASTSGAATVSSQYLTLVSLEGEPEKDASDARTMWALGDPFFYSEHNERAFSSLPFLSVTMVTILPDPQENPVAADKGDPPCTRQSDVNAFLTDCAGQLREIVRDTCREIYRTGQEVDHHGVQVVYQVYHCVNSGNFCIVVRSRRPDLTYHISMQIRAETLNKQGKYQFPALDCSTFSLIGVECRSDQNGVAEVPPDIAEAEQASKVALRLSVTNQVRNAIFQSMPNAVTEDLSGLYGRYDVTLHLELGQFWQIYPWICAHKFGLSAPQEDIPPAGNGGGTIVSLLKRAMVDQGAQYINARLLIKAGMFDAPENSGARRKKRQLQVQYENGETKTQIDKVLKLVKQLPHSQEECRKSMLQLRDLWESYSGLRYQDDSFINGNMLLTQIRLLLDTIEHYIQSVDPMSEQMEYYQDLIVNLKKAINSISHFQKLMLSINQQSIQAPNYEVQMHADMEKFVVAYTEFSRRFLAEHFVKKTETNKLETSRQLIFPIITADIVKRAIQATPLFLLPYHEDLERELVRSNPNQEQLLLSIEIPDCDAFGNLYVTMPLICHELFHNFRIIDRDKRNDVLAHFLMWRVAQYIVRQWISQEDKTAAYAALGELENSLFVDKLTLRLCDAYQKWCPDIHKTANIGVLLTNILRFLMTNVFSQRDQDALLRPDASPKRAKEQLRQLCVMALDVSNGETPDWQDAYEACWTYLERMEKKGSCPETDGQLKQLEPLVEAMTMDVLAGHLAVVMETGLKYAEQIEAAEEARPDKNGEPSFADEAIDLLKEICAEEQALRNVFLSPDRMDRWIGEIYAKKSAILEGFATFQEKLPTHLDQSIDSQLKLSAQMLDCAICDLCRAIKDANHLNLLLRGRWQYDSMIDADMREPLLKQYHADIRLELERYYRERKTQHWLLHSAPQIQELIAPLGSDLEQEELFVRKLKTVLYGTSKMPILSIVNNSTILYREIFADLGMCVALKLNAFGYLRVLSRNDTFCEECRTGNAANMMLERMKLVCQLLLKDREAGCNWELLQTSCSRCLERVKAMVEQASVRSGDQERQKLWRKLGRLVRHEEITTEVPAFPIKVEIFEGWIREEQQDGYPELYQQLCSLWNLSHLTNLLAEHIIVGAGHPLECHFAELLAKIREQWKLERESFSCAAVMEHICADYNDPERPGGPKRGQEMFKDTLSFVLYYYYHSWNVYGSQQNTQNWRTKLMGG